MAGYIAVGKTTNLQQAKELIDGWFTALATRLYRTALDRWLAGG